MRSNAILIGWKKRNQERKRRMSHHKKYVPGRATGAEIQKDGDKWTLVVVRDLRHPPSRVWQALTDPAHLVEWAPFDADRNLATTGPVKLTTVGAPTPQVSESIIKRAEEPPTLGWRSLGSYGRHGSHAARRLATINGRIRGTVWRQELKCTGPNLNNISQRGRT